MEALRRCKGLFASWVPQLVSIVDGLFKSHALLSCLLAVVVGCVIFWLVCFIVVRGACRVIVMGLRAVRQIGDELALNKAHRLVRDMRLAATVEDLQKRPYGDDVCNSERCVPRAWLGVMRCLRGRCVGDPSREED